MKKVFIVGGGVWEGVLFEQLGFAVTLNPAEADIALFTGGEDINPSLYGDEAHRFTFFNKYRDEVEAEGYRYFRDNNIPMVGICRGGQLLNVLNGGRMYQHVNQHTRSHSITDVVTGETIYVTSTHHQMMMMAPEGLLVAYSTLGGDREWFDGQVAKRDVSNQDIEVVYYEKSKCLCFQPHPEYMDAEYEGMRTYFGGLLRRFFNLPTKD
jgi:anthranilate/para-aminobenzoate synthase component II